MLCTMAAALEMSDEYKKSEEAERLLPTIWEERLARTTVAPGASLLSER